jgi:NADPH-dependent 2,4-dienoyl-CoA reductase/sulfur reductase-like enzyme
VRLKWSASEEEETMKTFELAIAGGGLTAARAIKSYREAGGVGRIALFSEETSFPYHRPSLSKGLLRGDTTATPYVEDRAFYRDHGVAVMLGTRVTSIHTAARMLTAGGAAYCYEKLLIATGARPRRLNVVGADLPNVFPLRTVENSRAIREAARQVERAVVVGGGFIGMEVAASLRQLGVDVTLIHLGHGLFEQLGSERLSAELLALYTERGIDVWLTEEVAGFGGYGQLCHVRAKSGRRVEADMVVVGVGVVPNTRFLDGSGLAVDDGVVVNERFQTSAEGVYAAGDVANFFDPLYQRRRRIEHWSNANYQGDTVGRILAGEHGSYDAVSSFFSEIFDVTLKVFGDVSRFDQIRTRGSLPTGQLLTAYGDAGRVVGAVTVGQSHEAEAHVKELIAAHAQLSSLSGDLASAR